MIIKMMFDSILGRIVLVDGIEADITESGALLVPTFCEKVVIKPVLHRMRFDIFLA